MRASRHFGARPAITLFVLLGYGCATVVVPQHIELKSLKLGTNCITITDKRSAEELKYRETSGVGGSKYFADDTLKPRAVDLVACELTASLPTQYRDLPVELTRCDVGYYILVKHPGTSSSSPYVPSGIPVGVAIVGALLGGTLIAMLQRATADENAFVAIEVRVGEKELRSTQMLGIGRARSPTEAVEEALKAALAAIATQATELGSTPPPATNVETAN